MSTHRNLVSDCMVTDPRHVAPYGWFLARLSRGGDIGEELGEVVSDFCNRAVVRRQAFT